EPRARPSPSRSWSLDGDRKHGARPRSEGVAIRDMQEIQSLNIDMDELAIRRKVRELVSTHSGADLQNRGDTTVLHELGLDRDDAIPRPTVPADGERASPPPRASIVGDPAR